MSSREERRAQRTARREWEKKAKRSWQDQKDAAGSEEDRRLLERRRRHSWIAYALLIGAAIVAASHVLEHLGAFNVLSSPRAEDIAVGFPTAAAMALIGLLLLPAQPIRRGGRK